MAILWGRRWTREELLARVGRLEQVAGIRLVEGGDGAERGVRRYRLEVGALTGLDAIDAFARQNTAPAAEVQAPA